jgi:hypothetical protein
VPFRKKLVHFGVDRVALRLSVIRQMSKKPDHRWRGLLINSLERGDTVEGFVSFRFGTQPDCAASQSELLNLIAGFLGL